jgi:two-component system response regulator ResD
MSKLLIVEDQKPLLDLVRDWLAKDGYMVDCAETGPDALLHLKQFQYDLIVLDINLPGISGIDVCRAFRQKGGVTPIIFLTVNNNIDVKELGFEAGADDYLVKPFNVRELSVRVKAVLKRSTQGTKNGAINAGNITLNSADHAVTVDQEPVNLQPKEFALLEFLMRHPNQVFNSDALIKRVWPSSSEASADTVRSHITRIRQKLGASADVLVTVHGVGYKFVQKHY